MVPALANCLPCGIGLNVSPSAIRKLTSCLQKPTSESKTTTHGTSS